MRCWSVSIFFQTGEYCCGSGALALDTSAFQVSYLQAAAWADETVESLLGPGRGTSAVSAAPNRRFSSPRRWRRPDPGVDGTPTGPAVRMGQLDGVESAGRAGGPGAASVRRPAGKAPTAVDGLTLSAGDSE